jgi:hypothetical protein
VTTRVSSSSAIVSGTVAPNGLATSYHVEFGTSTAYGHSTPAVSAGAGGSVSVTLSGLRPHTVYHYRLVATSDGGTAAGADRTFRTAAAPARAPRFSFAVPARVSLRSALRGRIHVRFRCSRGCTAHFVVSVASAQTTRFTPVAITLAGGSGRIRHRGAGTATLRFRPGVRARLASAQVRLVVSGYAVARGSARSAPRSRRLTLS